MLKTYAAEIVHIGNIHLTVSVDGPQEIHDQVRGVEGCFERIREGLAQLDEIESGSSQKISRSICFTISRYSYHGLGAMPDVARSLGINSVAIVPYYFVPEHVGKEYENELQTHFGCPAFSWRGFHHADSGVEIDSFLEQYRTYLSNLGGIHNYPYMAFSEDDYRIWFGDPTTPVGIGHCPNVERLIDIQPQGKANFCVDFPDYEIGNVMDATIEALWNSERAQRFREYRRKQPLAICHRCGSKYMSA
jgi:radical SAM protein with 4Fe4S-binding SPASM domain